MEFLTRKLVYPYEYPNSIDDYQKSVNNLKKEDFFSKLKNDYPSNEELKRTKELMKRFNIKNGEELTQLYLKSDVLLLACVFEKFIKVSINEFGINPLYCVSLPGYTWQCGLKYTGINLQTLQDKDTILLLENNIRGGISAVMSDRYIKSDETKKILYADSTNLYDHSMSQPLPHDEIEMWHGHPDLYVNKLGEIIITPDDSDVEYFIDFDLGYPNNIKEKTKNFPFCPENKVVPKDTNKFYLKKYNLRIIQNPKKFTFDWTDKKNYLVQCRILNFHVRHGMVVDGVHEIISFRENMWLKKYIIFITQKRNKAKMILNKTSINYLITQFLEKQWKM